jgi:hypothetical protein
MVAPPEAPCNAQSGKAKAAPKEDSKKSAAKGSIKAGALISPARDGQDRPNAVTLITLRLPIEQRLCQVAISQSPLSPLLRNIWSLLGVDKN